MTNNKGDIGLQSQTTLICEERLSNPLTKNKNYNVMYKENKLE